jgi:GNAT superfamily N-acetyltransferase
MAPELSKIITRRALASDAEQIAFLYRQLVDSPAVNVLPERIAQLAGDANTALFVCERNCQIVATALVSLCADVMYGSQPYASVENFVVDKQLRRQGIGTALMAHVEVFCLNADSSKIMLLSAANRATAHGFFERTGFNGIAKRGFVKYRRDMRAAP